MKIGIFDSGLGGLIIAHSLIKALPQYNYLYLGDTARVPYGNRSQAEIYVFTEQGIEFLFESGCQLVIVACNTASSEALRNIQQNYMPIFWSERKVLGVLIPSAEEAARRGKKIGLIATQATIDSGAFVRELTKINHEIIIIKKATPLLVPVIEKGELQKATMILEQYLVDITSQIDTLILGSTHYTRLKNQAQDIVGQAVKVVSQDEVVPNKLKVYLERHPEIASQLSQNSSRKFLVTKRTPAAEALAIELMGQNIRLEQVKL